MAPEGTREPTVLLHFAFKCRLIVCKSVTLLREELKRCLCCRVCCLSIAGSMADKSFFRVLLCSSKLPTVLCPD